MTNLMPGNNNEAIQLLSGSRRKLSISVPGENRPILIGAVFLVLVAAAFGGLKFYLSNLQNELSALDNELLAEENKRDQQSELEILTWNKKLSLAGGLVSNHIVWSQAVRKIQNLTPSPVQFLSFRLIWSEEKIDIKGVAPSYAVIAKTVAALANDPVFTDVSLNKISGLSLGLLEYDLRISFARDKLLLGLMNSKDKISP